MARVFFVTNRNYLEGDSDVFGVKVFGSQYHPDGVAAVRYGYADLLVTDKKSAEVKDFRVYPEPDQGAPAQDQPDVGGSAFLAELKQAILTGCRHTLFFIHGYNVSFVEALQSAALLSETMPFEDGNLNVVLFSWPSDGKKIPFRSYYSDREDARVSGPALARVYLRLWDFIVAMDENAYCGRQLHILAHSMGNYVLRQGLQALRAKEPRRIARLFDQIILAAADEDDDAFETDDKLRLLPALGRQVTAYYNRNDRALIISDKTKTNPDRLGSDGPRMIDMVPKKVAFVDCSRFAHESDRLMEHSYFVNCKSITDDLRCVLEGLLPDDVPGRQMLRPERLFRIVGDGKPVSILPTPPK